MIHVKQLEYCALNEVIEAWNEGFKGYVADLHMDMDAFLKRTVQEKLSPRYSHVAFDDEKPIGILVSGIKERGGLRTSWNGGTGVHPDYRDQGVGHKLVEASLKLYEQEDVELATLEAVSDNDSAIHLYEKHGYVVEDHLSILQQAGQIHSSVEIRLLEKQVSPERLVTLAWYPVKLPWQSHEDQAGELYIRGFYKGEELIGYTVQKKQEENGELTSIAVYQLELNPVYQDDESLIQAFLNQALYADKNIKRTNINLRHSNPMHDLVLSLGFQEVFKQVWMLQTLNN
ncbi:GNAT family N-acetyltransferase [Pontibacillus sp. HMF3514]|uniref:GNAT family N-acetyltransferase n=1 Tax=Pontibacillus sp. HMF3514 TaxID=2692425 RepID=UPI001320324E|nr:GNAT family N-acetyltransferase [Pontibacillus sp. HMF3514]QHE53911.1 GNAT family N-acetyltransferase [Pontibacillus sp. HMF3514]